MTRIISMRIATLAFHCLFMVALLSGPLTCLGDEKLPVHDFDRAVKPLLKQYCYGCHNAKKTKGEIDLTRFATADALAADPERLQGMLEVVSEAFMPPKKAKRFPTKAERKIIAEWLSERLHRIAMKQAGDPGLVVIRRLTNAELSYTISDLTGIQRDWTKGFPRDGSGGEGFSNTGQTLQMSASQIEKYLALAGRLANQALLLPGSGPVFFESSVEALPKVERARIALERLDKFCRKSGSAYADRTPNSQIMSYAYPDQKRAFRDKLVPLRGYRPYSRNTPGAILNYVQSLFRLFYRTERLSPTALTFMVPQGEITRPTGKDKNALTKDDLRHWQDLWLDFRFASGYDRPFKISMLHRWFSSKPHRLGENAEFEARMAKWRNGKRRLDPARDLSFTVLSLASYIREIRPVAPEALTDFANIQLSRDGESRGLMVPNHDAFDAFVHLYLSDKQIESLWKMVCDPKSKLAVRLGGVPPAQMQAEWKALEKQRRDWRARQLPAAKEAMCRFAARAWRRPLIATESSAIRAQLDTAVGGGRTLTGAMRLTLVRIFMSPHFLYRIEYGKNDSDKKNLKELGDYELANRLSYFLWSSMPDQQLLDAAARGELRDPERLAAQARRMMKDPRIRRFSREMFGQWLGFYRFEDFDRPNPKRFPEFDAQLRGQMYAEAIDFCADLVANDRDIRLLLNADYAFLPPRLAQHYGISKKVSEAAWAQFKKQRGGPIGLTTAPRVSLATTKRRGVLGWGAYLTANAHPLRTSPVLRGKWILADLLGKPTPPPPNAVPDLPKDEKNESGLTIAQMLAKHREDSACAVCHDRIDPLGLALENFDPIGRWRDRDINGTPVNIKVALRDGTKLDSLEGLIGYLNHQKQRQQFCQRFSRKVLGFSLGRSVLLGDTPLLNEISAKLQANDYRFSNIVASIVTSQQFRHLRSQNTTQPPKERKKP
jgi:hypothetical protein